MLLLALVILFSNINDSRSYKRELVVSNRLIETHIWLIANLIRVN